MLKPIEDAAVMRALSHPTRIALLEVLQVHPALTATEAGELIGETSTNCAFHLRALAKFGFVEEAGSGPGRRRPWRLTEAPTEFSDVQDSPEQTVAARDLSDVLIGHWLRRIAATQAARHVEPAEWQQVLGASQSIAVATPAEIQQLVIDIRALLGRFDDRLRNPQTQPENSRPVELLLFAQPFAGENRGGQDGNR